MVHDRLGMRQIATAGNIPAYVYPEVDNGWVFWQFRDSADRDYEKGVYDTATGQLFSITSDAAFDNSYSYFEDGKVLWQSDQGLMFFNGTQTVTLAASGNYSSFAFGGGCVAWAQGSPIKIMLYDGTSTLNLSQLGIASTFSIQYPGGAGSVQGRRVAWYGKEASNKDEEILFYDGASVQQLTDNTIRDYAPQVCGNQVAWASTTGTLNMVPYDIWFYDGQQNTRVWQGLDPMQSPPHAGNLRVAEWYAITPTIRMVQ